MKKFYLLLFLFPFYLCLGAEVGEDCDEIILNFNDGVHMGEFSTDDFNLDIEDDEIIFKSNENHDVVVMTKDCGLLINNESIDLNGHQTDMVCEYRELMYGIVDEAKDLGLAGAKVGLKGAAIGLTAAASVVKLLLPGYDEDDLERDIEFKTEKLELEAEKLEKKGEEIEVMGDHLDDLHDELKDNIPELKELGWF